MIVCKRCGFKDIEEKNVELHHLIPKSIGGTDKEGRRYLCKKCHDIWHNMLPKIIFDYLRWEEKDKDKLRQYIKNRCLKYVGEQNEDNNSGNIMHRI